MSAKHTPGLTREQVFRIAEKYGSFEYGDAQGDKRLDFAADVIATHEHIRAAAPELLEALERIANGPWPDWIDCPEAQCRFDEQIARAAIAKAEGRA